MLMPLRNGIRKCKCTNVYPVAYKNWTFLIFNPDEDQSLEYKQTKNQVSQLFKHKIHNLLLRLLKHSIITKL